MTDKLNVGELEVQLTGNSTKFRQAISKTEALIQRTAQSIERHAKTMTAAFSVPIAAIGTASVKAFSDFEAAMTKSTAIMGNLSEEMRQQLEGEAFRIARVTATSATDLAESYFFLASAGLDAKQSIAALSTVQTFAAAGAFDMATATDLLTDAQTALGLSSKDTAENIHNMTRLSDVLIKANTMANASAEQFSRSLVTKAGGALKQLNKDVEEGVAVLAAYADAGIKGEQAGEKLHIVLRDLQTASRKNSQAWTTLGLSIHDTNGNVLPLTNILSQLEDRFEGMSDKQRAATAALLGFQDRSFSALQTLIGTSDKIREYERRLRSAGGVTQEVADRQMKSFANQMKVLENQINIAAIKIGRTLAPFIARAAKEVEKFLVWWDTLEDQTRENVILFTATAAALPPVILGIGLLTSSAAKLVGVLGLLPIAVATVYDAWQQVFNPGSQSQTGILDMIQNFELFGVKIKDAAYLLGNTLLEAWMTAMGFIKKGLGWVLSKVPGGKASGESLMELGQQDLDMADTLAIQREKRKADMEAERQQKEEERRQEALKKTMIPFFNTMITQMSNPPAIDTSPLAAAIAKYEEKEKATVEREKERELRPNTEFQTLSLRRFSLASLPGPQEKQEVRARGVEERLDKINETLQNTGAAPARMG